MSGRRFRRRRVGLRDEDHGRLDGLCECDTLARLNTHVGKRVLAPVRTRNGNFKTGVFLCRSSPRVTRRPPCLGRVRAWGGCCDGGRTEAAHRTDRFVNTLQGASPSRHDVSALGAKRFRPHNFETRVSKLELKARGKQFRSPARRNMDVPPTPQRSMAVRLRHCGRAGTHPGQQKGTNPK